MTTSDFELGSVIESRYRIDHRFPGESSGSAYLATPIDGGGRVKLVEVPAETVRLLSRAALVEHRSLATLRELVLVPDGRTLAVVDHVAGKTLDEELRRQGPLNIREAIACAFVLADGLAELHRHRASHGLLQPASVVLKARGRNTAVLSYAPLLQGANPYLPPERNTLAPSPADDVWALAALLHTALLGNPPPCSGYASRNDLVDAGVGDPKLADLLSGCLAARRANRISLMQPVREALAAWSPAAPATATTAVEQPSSGTSPVAISLPPSRRGQRARWSLGLVSVAVLGAGSWFLITGHGASSSSQTPGKAKPAAVPAASHPRTAPSLAALPPIGSRTPNDALEVHALPSTEELASCLVRQFPPGTFRESPAAEWLCETPDPRLGSELMRKALVRGAGPDRTTEAMKVWSRLVWYGMAAFAVVQRSCCKQAAAALELPSPPACGAPGPVLAKLADTIARGAPHGEALAEYREIVTCQSLRGREARFRVTTSLASTQEEAFLALLVGRQSR